MKNFITTPCFAKAALLEKQLEHFYKSPPKIPFIHAILLNHYPVNKEENNERIRELAKQYGCTLIDSGGDIGLHRSLNNAVEKLGISAEDRIYGLDSDDFCSHGWIDAVHDVMNADKAIAVCGLNFWVLRWKQGLEGHWPEATIAGHKVWVHPGIEMFNAVGINMSLVHDMGGFTQPNAYYGGFEIALYQHWVKKGMKLCYLQDFSSEVIPLNREDTTLFDPEYTKWKVAHAHKGFRGGFEEWLMG